MLLRTLHYENAVGWLAPLLAGLNAPGTLVLARGASGFAAGLDRAPRNRPMAPPVSGTPPRGCPVA
jgi:hypothetical protein